jgi:hypothetical protein
VPLVRQAKVYWGLFTKHLQAVTQKATGVFLQLFPLLARDTTLSLYNKLTLYKLMIRPILTYASPVWSNTSQFNYRHLQILPSKCLKSNRRLSQTNPHTPPSFHPLNGLHSYVHLPADREIFFWISLFSPIHSFTKSEITL